MRLHQNRDARNAGWLLVEGTGAHHTASQSLEHLSRFCRDQLFQFRVQGLHRHLASHKTLHERCEGTEDRGCAEVVLAVFRDEEIGTQIRLR